jgi:hypothetical protein
MNLLFVILAAVLAQAAFVLTVRKLHDRSIHQALARAFTRLGW